MSSSHRFLLLIALPLGVALPAATALATSPTHPSSARVTATAAQDDDAGDEILLEVAYSWKVKGSKISGTVTNGDRSDVSGTAKVTRDSSGRTLTLARGGKLAVAVGHKQVLTLSLTKTGKSFFKRHKTVKAQLVLDETAGTRSGDVTEDIKVHRAS